MAQFTKQALGSEALVAKLEGRGLVVTEDDRRLAFLLVARLGYYRLTGFCVPFHQKMGNGKKVLRKGTTLRQVYALYQFDTALRQHALTAMATIEVAIATSICDYLCRRHGPHWYLIPKAFSSAKGHEEILLRAFEAMKFDEQARKGKPGNPNEFLDHYYKTYTEPPSAAAWMLRECASFGFWSMVFENLPGADQTAIASAWCVPARKPLSAEIFHSWLHALTVFRNNCAHHNRITHRSLRFRPKAPAGKEHVVSQRMNSNDHNDIHSMLIVIDALMNFLGEDRDWKAKLRLIFENAKAVKIGVATGFASNWEADRFWQAWPEIRKKKAVDTALIEVPKDVAAAVAVQAFEEVEPLCANPMPEAGVLPPATNN